MSWPRRYWLGPVRTASGGMRRHKVQAIAIGLVVLVSTASATLGLALLAASNAPFTRAFGTQNGAHVTVTVNAARASTAELAATSHLSGVTAAAGPFSESVVQTQFRGQPFGQMVLAGRVAPGGPVDDVVLNAGHWPDGPGQVVLDGSAGGGGPALGSTITVTGVPGTPALVVVGFGNSVTNTADGWVTPAEITRLRAPGVPQSTQMLYRFSHAASYGEVRADVTEVSRALPAGAVTGAASWLAAQNQATGNGAIMEPFVVAFALIGLVMAVLIVGNVVSGAVVASYTRIGVLKCIGLSPAQVVVAYLSRVGWPALAGCLAGVVAGNVLAAPVLHNSAGAYGVGSQQVPWWSSVIAPAGMFALVLLAGFGPALRAGRLSAAEAIAAGRAPRAGRGYAAHRLAARLRLPRPGLGLAAPFARPARTVVTLAAVAFGATAVIFAFGLSSSLSRAAASQSHSATIPVRVEPFGPGGGPGQMPTPAQDAAVVSALRVQPGTRHEVTLYGNGVKVPGIAGTVMAQAYDGDASWTGYGIIAGHWYGAPGEVDVNTAFLEQSGLAVGDTVTVNTGSAQVTVRIAGEVFDPGSEPSGVRQHADAARRRLARERGGVRRGVAARCQRGLLRPGGQRRARRQEPLAGHQPAGRRQVLHDRQRPGERAGPDGRGRGGARRAQHGADDDQGPGARPGRVQGARHAARPGADHGGVLDRRPRGGGRGDRGARRGRAEHGHRARHGRDRAHRHPGQLHPGVPAVPAGAAVPGRGGHRGRRGVAARELGRPGPAGRGPSCGVNHKVDTVTAGRRVVIAEDSVLLLAGLTKLLESAGFEVAATAADAAELLAAVEREQPDVVIADVRMPPTHTDEGIRAALVIRSEWPDVAVLVLSQYVEERYAADLLSANTHGIGYLLKDRVADVAEFLDALRRVAAGGTALDPEVVAQLLVRRGGDPLDNLTERELGVLALMAEGRSNAEIAAALVITDSAVSKHINSIFAKLGLYPGDAGHRRVLAVLRYLGVEPALSGAAAASAACSTSMKDSVRSLAS